MSRRYLVLATLAALACGGDGATEPDPYEDGVPESQLTFLRLAADMAPPAVTDTAFWVVAGEDRELVLFYEPEPGEDEGEEFMEFRVRADGLWRRPDGTRIAEGDSVQIRVTVDPDGRFLFRFAPAGLRFNPDAPAELEITYRKLGGDVDDDGDVDADDDDLEERMRLWRQQAPGDPWFPIGTIRFKDTDEIRGEVTHFTAFAIAA